MNIGQRMAICGPGPRHFARRQRLGDRLCRQRAAFQRIGNALAGHRIDQAGSIADEKHVAKGGIAAKIAKRQEGALDLGIGAALEHQRIERRAQVGVFAVQAANADSQRASLGKFPAIAPGPARKSTSISGSPASGR